MRVVVNNKNAFKVNEDLNSPNKLNEKNVQKLSQYEV